MSANWFSNFIPYEEPCEFHGLKFKTPEHLYQALKTDSWEDTVKIANCDTPGQAKRMGGKVKLRANFESIKKDLMRFALEQKFNRDTKFGQRLIETKERCIEWNNWHDKIWGKCICPKCGGNGTNLLGEVLMEIRTTLNELEVP